jgi:hypothetical protein
MPNTVKHPLSPGFRITDGWLFCAIVLPLFAALALGIWHDAWGLMSATISLCVAAVCSTWRDVSRARRITSNDL